MNSTVTASGQQEGMTVLSGMLIAFAMSWFSTLWSFIPWPILFIALRYYKIRLYSLTKEDDCKRIQRRIKISSHTSDNNKNTGYAFGKWYFLYLHGTTYNEDVSVWMIAMEDSYQELVRDNDDDDEEEAPIIGPSVIPEGPSAELVAPTTTNAKKFTIYDRRGDVTNVWYRSRIIKSMGYTPKPEQAVIMEQIKQVYSKKNRGVFYIYGPPCSGKSHVGVLLSEYYNGGYTNSFAPWAPGDTMNGLAADIDATKDKPIIVALDEIDIPLTDIHTKKIITHKNIDTSIRDKIGWNRFFDNFQRGFFPFIIIIMTSNKNPSYINEMDNSYIASHRCDGIYELNNKKE